MTLIMLRFLHTGNSVSIDTMKNVLFTSRVFFDIWNITNTKEGTVEMKSLSNECIRRTQRKAYGSHHYSDDVSVGVGSCGSLRLKKNKNRYFLWLDDRLMCEKDHSVMAHYHTYFVSKRQCTMTLQEVVTSSKSLVKSKPNFTSIAFPTKYGPIVPVTYCNLGRIDSLSLWYKWFAKKCVEQVFTCRTGQ